MDQKTRYEFFDSLLLRLPTYSFKEYAMENAGKILADKVFQNALWLASPGFYKVLKGKNFEWGLLSEKEQLSVQKYYNRMSYRPTPFGAFASVSLINWNEKDKVSIADDSQSILHLLPSVEWLDAYLKRESIYKGDIFLAVNPTAFLIADNYRFVRSDKIDSQRLKFKVNEIAAEDLNRMLIEICFERARKRSDLIIKVVQLTACEEQEASEYLDFLIDEQVLLPKSTLSLLAPESTGQEWKDNNEIAAFWNKTMVLPFLSTNVVESGARLDELTATLSMERQSKNFYAGLERVATGGLSIEIQPELLKAVELLQKIVIPFPTPALKKFKDAFYEKFEDQKIPLLKALDPDAGISYGGLYLGGEDSLLSDVFFTENQHTKRLDWTPVHELFLELWHHRENRGKYEPLIIADRDIEQLRDNFPGWSLPPTLALMFTRSEGKLVLDNAGGASAVSLIGRFSVFNEEITALCKLVAGFEIDHNPDVAFAEIHQLSDIHVDNINRRRRIYNHVISVNTYPATQDGVEIPLSDLLISIINGELWLESVSLKKRIIPRLPTAYNFHHNELALFQMLCDLQFEGLQGNLTFDLEKLFPGQHFYPRVEYGNVIISLARWIVSQKEVDLLRSGNISIGRLHLFRQERGIPRLVTIGLSDQQLVFDLGNDPEALCFLQSLDRGKSVTIREYLHSDNSVTMGKKVFSNQFISLLKKPATTYPGVNLGSALSASTTQRSFLPASKWLFLKIYCSPESADNILLELIDPFLQENEEEINKWFFIRYYDPEPHIRFRVESVAPSSTSLLEAFNNSMTAKKTMGLIRNVQNDTYNREIERYSEELIVDIEELFQAGSNWTLAQIRSSSESGEPSNVMLSFGLVMHFAISFFKDNRMIEEFFKWRSETFLKEFSANEKLQMQMDQKYRSIKNAISSIVENQSVAVLSEDLFSEVKSALAIINTKSSFWDPSRRLILLADLIHMQVNRMFKTTQRQYEALICYCLFKYMREQNARQKTS